jgi:hypothetical protein
MTAICLSSLLLLLAGSVLLHSSVSDAFSSSSVSLTVTARSSTLTSTRLQVQLLPVDVMDLASTWGTSVQVAQVSLAQVETDVDVANIESWRQYVPLVVSVGIIGDILLGSPLANMIMAPMRPENREDEETVLAKAKRPNVDKSKERIDTEKYAQAAIDKARNTLELRQFLDERKTDWDKMEDIKRKLDADMQDLDEDLANRNNDFENRKSK